MWPCGHSSEPDNCAPSYCDCEYPARPIIRSFKGNINELITCKCGEDEGHLLRWVWETESAQLECLINGPNVIFHPVYSRGTSIVRGGERLLPGMIHYWEVKIQSCAGGTDLMIGIGTEKVDLLAYQDHYASVLGSNEQSWGYSYHGKVQHNGELKRYGKGFSQGCIIGVYLDLFRGELEFYLNRRPLGVAYRNIPTDSSIRIYPMACSTSAKSAIKLINSTSCIETLQFQAMKRISKCPSLLAELHRMPGLKYITNEYWFLTTKEQFQYLCESQQQQQQQNNLALEDEILLMSSKLKRPRIKDDDIEVDDLYENAHKISHRECGQEADDDEDDEFNLHLLAMFCDR